MLLAINASFFLVVCGFLLGNFCTRVGGLGWWVGWASEKYGKEIGSHMKARNHIIHCLA